MAREERIRDHVLKHPPRQKDVLEKTGTRAFRGTGLPTPAQRLRVARRLDPRAGVRTNTFRNSPKRERLIEESDGVEELRDFICDMPSQAFPVPLRFTSK